MDIVFAILILFGGILSIILLTSVFKFNTFLSLLLVSLLMALMTLPTASIVPVLKKGFGGTLESIGLIIILGTIIGIVLDQSGAALSIARFFLKRTGEKNAPAAMSITGFMTGLPIFCDSGFIVLSGICRSLAQSSKTAITVMAPVLAISLYGVHCLVPPHPGATAATSIIGAPIGSVILLGTLVAIPGIIAAYYFIRFRSRKVSFDVSANDSNDQTSVPMPVASLAFLPILVPLALITLKSVFFMTSGLPEDSFMKIVIGFTGDPVIALLFGCFAAFPLLRKFNVSQWNKLLDSAIEKAGPILIVTAAGGTFGAVIKESGIVTNLGQQVAALGLGLFIPYIIAVILKTSQGSSTIAIITAASIAAPLLDNLGLSGEWGKTLAILAMGAGSMMVSHANDSFFWVISKFSGMTSAETLRYYSVPTVILSLVSFAVIGLLSLVLI
ncbi:MAG: GntP family permease [Prolixibacteraceae bacterium]|jgi:GntP family gluconate:H+ symporter